MKVAQSCPILWDPMDSAVHGILQARILEWVYCPISRGSSWPRNQTRVSWIAGRFRFTDWAMTEAMDFPGVSDGKVSAYNAGHPGLIPGLGRFPGEKEMANHSSILAWKIQWTEECGWLHTVQGIARVRPDLATKPPPPEKSMDHLRRGLYFSGYMIKKSIK